LSIESVQSLNFKSKSDLV